MKIIPLIAVSVASLLIGAGGGSYWGGQIARSQSSIKEFVAFGEDLKELDAARTSGNDVAYKEALWGYWPSSRGASAVAAAEFE